MNEEEHHQIETQESKKEALVNYKGPLGYYVRQAGIEEGAHAVFFSVKSHSERGVNQVETAKQSVVEVASEAQESIKGSSYVATKKNIEDLNDNDIYDLIDFNNEEIPPIVSNRRQAMQYCREFIDGVKFPVEKVYKDQPSGIKFGIVTPSEGSSFYDFFYNLESNTVCINRSTLINISQYNPETEITASSNNQEYDNQEHERRALTWQIADARKHGFNDIADSLKRKYDMTKRQD